MHVTSSIPKQTYIPNLRCGGVFDWQVLESRSGFLAARLIGKTSDINQFLKGEAGGHRFQRVPPTEKRGRVHTSTVTTSVLPEPSASEVLLNERDLEFKTCRGSGAGGQHRNVTDSAVQLTHKPSGIQVRVESERSQHQNKELARILLRARLQEADRKKQTFNRNQQRRDQVGGGSRGDKRRTIALQRGQATDHISGKKVTTRKYLRGYIEDLW